jgi:hypothetical protein
VKIEKNEEDADDVDEEDRLSQASTRNTSVLSTSDSSHPNEKNSASRWRLEPVPFDGAASYHSEYISSTPSSNNKSCTLSTSSSQSTFKRTAASLSSSNQSQNSIYSDAFTFSEEDDDGQHLMNKRQRGESTVGGFPYSGEESERIGLTCKEEEMRYSDSTMMVGHCQCFTGCYYFQVL